MAKEERYYVSVKQEGAAGATRGKLSSAACQALGAEDGDVIEIRVKGQRIVGGGILSTREAKEYHREHSRGTAKKTPAKKTRKSRDDDDSSEAPRKSKKAAKPKVKSKKRKTSVDYDSSRPKKAKKGKKGKFKLGKR